LRFLFILPFLLRFFFILPFFLRFVLNFGFRAFNIWSNFAFGFWILFGGVVVELFILSRLRADFLRFSGFLLLGFLLLGNLPTGCFTIPFLISEAGLIFGLTAGGGRLCFGFSGRIFFFFFFLGPNFFLADDFFKAFGDTFLGLSVFSEILGMCCLRGIFFGFSLSRFLFFLGFLRGFFFIVLFWSSLFVVVGFLETFCALVIFSFKIGFSLFADTVGICCGIF